MVGIEGTAGSVTGETHRTEVTENNELVTLDRGTPLLVSMGSVVGMSHNNKFGRQSNLSANTRIDIWDKTGSYVFLDEAERIYVRSSSAGDDAGEEGGQEVLLTGLSGNWSEIDERITLNGLGSVESTQEFFRLNRMRLTLCNGSETNIGSIVATGSTSGFVQAMISVEEGQTLMCIYTVPGSKTGYMTSYYGSVDKTAQAATVDMRLMVRPSGECWQDKNRIGMSTVASSHLQHQFNPYFRIEGQSDIRLDAESTANTTDVHAGFDIILVDK